MDSVNKKILIISILLALFTSFLAYIYIKNVTSRQETVEYVTVYVAAKTLPARHKITDGDLAEAKVTRDYLNPKAVLNKADIVGKRLKDSVIEGEQILRDRLVGNSDLTLAYNIPEGMRAVSININDQSNVSHLVRPGDFVDVIASFESEEEEEGENRKIYPRITKIVLQNIQVLALGQDMSVASEKLSEAPKTITLAVTPQDAENLVYINEYAVIMLALRPADSDEKANTQGTVLDDIVTGKGIKVLPK